MITSLGVYAGLFFAAFVAATILPMQSETALVALISLKSYPVWLLVVVASLGNVAGSIVNWLLGRGIEHLRDRRWFPVKGAALGRAQAWYHRYGKWSLLLSWAPLVGDPLTVAAGIMREPFGIFLLLVTLAKVGRYVVLALITVNVL
nr:YqaA family protein [Rhizobium sp. RM]